MKSSQITALVTPSAPTLSPDGAWAVVGADHPDLELDAYPGQLWLVATDGSTPPRRLTRGRSDTAPRYSPDGSLLAFLRSSAGSAPQLHVLDARGGEPVAVTDAPLGVGEFTWSPDGTRIAYIARVPEKGRYGTVDGLGPAAEPARLITELSATANGVGYLIDRRAQLHVVDVPDVTAEPVFTAAPSADDPKPEPRSSTPTSRRLTGGPYDHSSPSFTADGSQIVVVAARHDGRDTDRRSGIWLVGTGDVVDDDGSETRAPRLYSDSPALADLSIGSVRVDGDELLVVAQDLGESGRDFVAVHSAVYRITSEGDVIRLTDPAAFDVADGARPLPYAGGLLVPRRTRGRIVLDLLTTDAEGTTSSTTLVGGDVEVDAVAVSGDGSRAVATLATPTSMGELALVPAPADAAEADASGLTILTDFGAALRDVSSVTPIEITVPAPDGYPVHGWIAVPDGPGPHPVLLNIHGGPFSQYTATFFDETQVFVEAGYAVVYGNPRGSAGYGQEHGRAIRQAMGTVDLDDVLALLDGAIASDARLDGERVGVMGGSYGGYLTAWTIAHDHRFAGAIVERGFLDPDAFVGTSDIGMFFGDEYVGTDPERMREQSPQAVVSQVTTPTFVVHSELDLRCPLSQAERYFAALRRQGTTTRLLVFPGENHELSRRGRPRHRVQRFDAMLAWWAEFLPSPVNTLS